MENLSLIVTGITMFCLLIGVISGLRHGFIGSILRLGSLAFSFMIAWFCREPIAKAILENGALDSILGGAADLLQPVLMSLLSVLIFVVVLSVLKLVCGIVLAVLGVFLPKGASGLGALFGIVQGVLIAFCVCVPINGFLVEAGNIVTNLSDAEMNGKPLVEALENAEKSVLDAEKVADWQESLDSYADSGISKLYTSVGKGYYKALISVKIEGKSISDYIDASMATIRFVEEFAKLGDVDFSAGLTAENRDSLKQTFKNLNEIKGDMSEDAQGIVNDLMSTLIGAVGAEFTDQTKDVLDDFDMSKVDFEKEGDTILKLYDLSNAEAEQKPSASEVVNTMAESELLLSVMESMVANEVPVEISDAETRAEVEAAIANVGVTDPEAAASLYKIFGLNH